MWQIQCFPFETLWIFFSYSFDLEFESMDVEPMDRRG